MCTLHQSSYHISLSFYRQTTLSLSHSHTCTVGWIFLPLIAAVRRLFPLPLHLPLSKVIGARYYTPSERDPIDRNGHGTHSASIAAGNIVKGVSFNGLAAGNARSGVPSARIAVYKICNTRGNCAGSNILAAFDDAIDDGVDIITVSLGSGPYASDFYSDPFAIGAFHAMEKGILTSKSAGNSGPKPTTVAGLAPWLLTVAASSTDRQLIDKVILGDGTTLIGTSINPFKLNGAMFPLVYGKEVSTRCNASMAQSCSFNCLSSKLVKGKIVLCDGIWGIDEAFRVNALGAIVLDNRYRDKFIIVPLPAIVLSTKDGNKVKSYMNITKMPQANIMKSGAVKDYSAPIVASFSSRGPNVMIKHIIKPDITAPGVNILAAYSPVGNPFDFNGKLSVNYSIASGTSMSCPHAAAAAAYVKTFHPQWSPSAIKSALMTTAWPMNATKNSDREFAFGAGHINPPRAVKPGLVYEALIGDYINMLCDIGYDSKKVRAISRGNNSCSGRRGSATELNYPSMAACVHLFRPFKIQFPRTVTNVGLAKSTYKVKVSADARIKVNVTPQVLSFNSIGQKKSFVVTVSGKGFSADSMASGSLIWFDIVHSVRSPIVVYAKTSFGSSSHNISI